MRFQMCSQLFNPAATGDGNAKGVVIKSKICQVSVPAFVFYENNSGLLWTVRPTLCSKPVCSEMLFFSVLRVNLGLS